MIRILGWHPKQYLCKPSRRQNACTRVGPRRVGGWGGHFPCLTSLAHPPDPYGQTFRDLWWSSVGGGWQSSAHRQLKLLRVPSTLSLSRLINSHKHSLFLLFYFPGWISCLWCSVRKQKFWRPSLQLHPCQLSCFPAFCRRLCRSGNCGYWFPDGAIR